MNMLAIVLLGGLLGPGAWASADAVPAASLRSMGQAAIEKRSPAERRALDQFAKRHPHDINGALAHLVLGYSSYQQKQYAQAREHFQAARLPETPLRDYAEYYQALSELAEGNHAAVVKVLEGYAKRYPASPLAAPAFLKLAESLLELDRTAEARAFLLAPPVTLPQAAAESLLAEADRKQGQLTDAAERYQSIYYRFPRAPQAAEAEGRLKELRSKLGTAFPSPSLEMREARAERLFEAKQWREAQKEYQALAAAGNGAEGDHAAVRAGVCQFHSGATWPALTTLLRMRISDPEADAERLYTLAAAYRRLERPEGMEEQIRALREKYPQSPWYEKALYLAGNTYRMAKDTPRSIEYYRMVYERFPQGEQAATTHWYVAWQAYRERRFPEAELLLNEQIRNYPASPQVPAALYWSGRLIEKEAPAEAAAYYRRLVEMFPNYYYGLLARERLATLPSAAERVASGAKALLPDIPRPANGALSKGTLSPADEEHLNRVKLLESAWLMDWAVGELSAVLRNGSSSFRLVQELARLEQERGRHHVAMRYAKRYVSGYFALDLSELSRSLWEVLFPLPWWEQVKKNADKAGLDPYLVAGLIRQESEFDPQARSRSNARGLMQLLPSTARLMARKVPDARARRYSLAALYRPEISLIYGTYYLREVLDRLGGIPEHALAGYNAGPRRVEEWTREASFEDPAEFVESIPITETREYVQAVLRNAALYRKLYQDGGSSGSDSASRPLAFSPR
ncbi:MAG: hypothetical protein A3J28_14865 [Acidobacteria bacterium RIFCSPLOWO2_12_FULL_60_22]|nr:MAG: hypothetical protein A3J28_14865 [Acidobacteria bacterium RIFCSPLOWO2_12_FULL_60_22]